MNRESRKKFVAGVYTVAAMNESDCRTAHGE